MNSKHLIISRGTEFVRIPMENLIYVEADGNYSQVITRDDRKLLVMLQLGQIEDLIADQIDEFEGKLLRIGRYYIINLNYVHIIDTAKQLLVLSDCAGCYYKLTPSKESLVKLRSYVESMKNEL